MEASFEGNVEPAVPEHDWWLYLTLGIALLILGLVAIALPFLTALAVNAFIGVLLVIGGVLQIVHVFRRHQTVGKIVLGLIVAALYLIAGLILLAHPFTAVLSLTLFLAAFFMVSGIFRIIAAVEMRGLSHWGWALFGGVLSVILGMLIWAHWPSSAVWALGLIVGIDLLFMGWGIVLFALGLHVFHGTAAGRLAGQH